MYVKTDFFERTGVSKPILSLMIGFSCLAHFILFGIIFFFPDIYYKAPAQNIVNVDLVSLPAIAPEPVKEPHVPEPEVKEPEIEELEKVPEIEEPEPEEIPEPEPEEMVVPLEPPKKIEIKKEIEKPEPVELTVVNLKKKESLKKKTLKSKKLVVDAQKDSVKKAIAKIKRSQRDYNQGRFMNYGSGASASIELLKIYQAEIQAQIQRNWAFSDQMVFGKTNLKSIIVIEILRSGEIRDYWFETRSGNKYFDESVVKAIRKSNPLPPLPKSYIRPSYVVGLNFSPSGLRRGFLH